MIPPPIYDGSERSKEEFRRWVKTQQRMQAFCGVCLAIGMAAILVTVVISAIVQVIK